MNKIERIECNRFSSNYGDSNSSFGQPLGVKSIVIITVFSSNGDSRSHELYSGIYCPEGSILFIKFLNFMLAKKLL